MKNKSIADLVKNKRELIEMKKARFKTADASMFLSLENKKTNKALQTDASKDTDSVIKRTIIGNTYYWLDSHMDVHLSNTFSKSIAERGEKGKIWHLHDHEHKITAKVGNPQKVYEKDVLWSDLGVDKPGEVTVVMMDTDIMKSYNSLMFEEYKNGKVDQHSVGMYYIQIDLAVNDKDYPEEFKIWQDNIDKIGNKEKAEEEGFFWAVKEAKLIEISAVLEGSNELTPTLDAKDIQPSQDTDKKEPSQDTQKKKDERDSSNNIYTFI